MREKRLNWSSFSRFSSFSVCTKEVKFCLQIMYVKNATETWRQDHRWYGNLRSHRCGDGCGFPAESLLAAMVVLLYGLGTDVLINSTTPPFCGSSYKEVQALSLNASMQKDGPGGCVDEGCSRGNLGNNLERSAGDGVDRSLDHLIVFYCRILEGQAKV